MKLLTALVLTGVAAAGDVSLSVAGLQLTPAAWDKQSNFAKLERYARQAAAQAAQVVVAPEGFLEGYVGNGKRTPGLSREKYFAIGEELDGPLLSRVRELARELKIYLLVGFAERLKERMYNSVVMFSPEGGIVTHYSKTHTLDDEPFNTKGAELPVVTTPLGRWGTLICFDRQLPETSRILALKGAQIIFVPAWGGYGEMNDMMMRVRAYENGVHVVFVHPKRTLFIDPQGTVIARNDGEGDQIVTAEIHLNPRRPSSPILYRRPELYSQLGP